MKKQTTKVFSLALFVLFVLMTRSSGGHAQKEGSLTNPNIPKTWEDEAFKGYEVPLAMAAASPTHVSADFYYRMAVRKIYKSYPVYAPGKEPPGYLEWLKQQEPEIAFDVSKLKTENDWIKAGEIVFNAPVAFDALATVADVRDSQWYKKTGVPIGKDGTMPFFAYVIRKKGQIELGQFSCATCHTRVMADGAIIHGAQGNLPLSHMDGLAIKEEAAGQQDQQKYLEQLRFRLRLIYGTPWLQPDPESRVDQMSVEELIEAHEVMPPGVQARIGTSLLYPVQVPDLIGIKDRLYLDRTGHVRHRSIADLMRYSALNQGAFFYDSYGKFLSPRLPDPSKAERYSDEQLSALGLYIYSLKPPPNPNPFDASAARGQKIFERQGCANCHTPPLYTNNKLTPVEGFNVPEEHFKKYDVLRISVGTDPNLALKTRRATGYYKVPSLKGVWYRGPFEHSGSVLTLEDWFDPRRIRDDYAPTGFRGLGIKTRAVRGHLFGLNLSEKDRKDLIAFLKTL